MNTETQDRKDKGSLMIKAKNIYNVGFQQLAKRDKAIATQKDNEVQTQIWETNMRTIQTRRYNKL